MTDGQLVVAGTVIYWIFAMLRIKGTDPLANPVLRTLWSTVRRILMFIFVICAALVLTAP